MPVMATFQPNQSLLFGVAGSCDVPRHLLEKSIDTGFDNGARLLAKSDQRADRSPVVTFRPASSAGRPGPAD
jgi:hypothetical protein